MFENISDLGKLFMVNIQQKHVWGCYDEQVNHVKQNTNMF